MTKLEAYIMRFIAFYRKVKEYYVRVIFPWVCIVGCFIFGIFGEWFWGKSLLSFIFFALGIIGLFLKLTGNWK